MRALRRRKRSGSSGQTSSSDSSCRRTRLDIGPIKPATPDGISAETTGTSGKIGVCSPESRFVGYDSIARWLVNARTGDDGCSEESGPAAATEAEVFLNGEDRPPRV